MNNKSLRYILHCVIALVSHIMVRNIFKIIGLGSLSIVYRYIICSCIAYWYSRKFIADKKHKKILSALPPLVIVLLYCIVCVFNIQYYGIGSYLYQYALSYLGWFGWLWSWSLIGTFSKKKGR